MTQISKELVNDAFQYYDDIYQGLGNRLID